MEEMLRIRYGKGAWHFYALSKRAILPESLHVHQHGNSLNRLFRGGFIP